MIAITPRVRLALLLLLATSTSSIAAAQGDTTRFDPIVVTATHEPMSRGALPVAVTVITGDELRRRGIATVAEALTDVTSAYVARAGSPGATTSLFLRGGESKYVKVLIDGVPVNDPGGRYDFASLTTDNVERIEVVRGPASVVHGADAATGVVHVITRRGEGPPRVDVRIAAGTMPRDRRVNAVSAGAMTTSDVTAAMSGALTGGSYSLAVARHAANGLYQLNNDYRNNVLSARFQLAPGDATTLRFNVRYHDYRFHYPTNSGGDAAPGDANAYRSEDRTAIGAEVERRIGAARVVLALNSSVNDGGTDDQADGAGDDVFVSQDKTRRRGGELRAHFLPWSRAAITTGVQFEQQDQRSQYQSDGPFGPFTERFSADRRNRAGYAELVLTPHARVTTTVGVRVDGNEQFGTFATGRAGVSWRAPSGTRLRVSAGTAFREPTFAENYSSGFVTGNPDLKPERTRGLDAGVEQELLGGRLWAGVTGFAQRFENIIDYTGGTGACDFSYCNVAEARSDGVELELRGVAYRAFHLGAGATLLRTEVLTPGFDNTSAGLYQAGESLIRRPETTWNLELAYRGVSPLSGSARLHVVGPRTDRDFRSFPATPVTLPGYARLDLAAAYAARVPGTSAAAVTVRVENATNAYYENIFNFLAPRRTIAVGVRVTPN